MILHDIVALLEDVAATHLVSGETLRLVRGQVGTVVLIYDDGACEVEFADQAGRAYALLPVKTEGLIVLRDAPQRAVA